VAIMARVESVHPCENCTAKAIGPNVLKTIHYGAAVSLLSLIYCCLILQRIGFHIHMPTPMSMRARYPLLCI
jgi:hypothetical protein